MTAVPPLGEHVIHVWHVPLTGGGRPSVRAALLSLLSAYVDRAVTADDLRTGPAGKPYLRGGGPHFNLAHSGDLALIALSGGVPLGVDLERPARRPHPGLASRICSEAEQAWIAAADDPDAALLRLWVRKEAAVKATGTGIGGAVGGLRRVDVLRDTLPGGWLLIDLPAPAPGFQAALAHQAPPQMAVIHLGLGDRR